jgi:hypothetical protein
MGQCTEISASHLSLAHVKLEVGVTAVLTRQRYCPSPLNLAKAKSHNSVVKNSLKVINIYDWVGSQHGMYFCVFGGERSKTLRNTLCLLIRGEVIF